MRTEIDGYNACFHCKHPDCFEKDCGKTKEYREVHYYGCIDFQEYNEPKPESYTGARLTLLIASGFLCVIYCLLKGSALTLYMAGQAACLSLFGACVIGAFMPLFNPSLAALIRGFDGRVTHEGIEAAKRIERFMK